MHAPLTEVSVEVAAVAMPVEQPAQVPQIFPELLGRDGRILPSLPGQRLPRNVRRRAEARFAHFPDLKLFLRVFIKPRVDRPMGLQRVDQRARFRIGVGLRVPAELD